MTIDFDTIFDELKPLFARYHSACVLIADAPDKYYLGTHDVRAKDGVRTWFGGLEIKKNYVSVHLVPVYAYPDLLNGIPDALRKKMQGKSCFNFKKRDDDLFAHLDRLIEASFQRCKSEGLI